MKTLKQITLNERKALVNLFLYMLHFFLYMIKLHFVNYHRKQAWPTKRMEKLNSSEVKDFGPYLYSFSQNQTELKSEEMTHDSSMETKRIYS
jgi:hypothetical protein